MARNTLDEEGNVIDFGGMDSRESVPLPFSSLEYGAQLTPFKGDNMETLPQDTLMDNVLSLLKEKISHFRSFRYASNLRGQHTASGRREQLRQFKTEKWLQAELVHHFWAKGIQVIPEYSEEKWDVYVPWPGVNDGFYLALKSLADSAQNASSDYTGVAKDLGAIAKSPGRQAFVALVLPLVTEPGDERRYKYSINMLQRIERHFMRQRLNVQRLPIPFVTGYDEGIQLIWIECKG